MSSRLVAVTINCRSRLTPWWPTRAGVIARNVLSTDPTFIGGQEAYQGLRQLLDRKLRKTHVLAGTNNGKALWFDPRVVHIDAGSVRRYSLGDGKHAIASRFIQWVNDKPVIVVSAHLLSSSKSDGRQKRRDELAQLIDYLERDYRDEPCLILMDGNDTSAGLNAAYWSHRFKDLKHYVPASQRLNTSYSTYNGFRAPAPRSSTAIDLILGRHVTADRYVVVVPYAARLGKKLSKTKAAKLYGSDHWCVAVRVVIP